MPVNSKRTAMKKSRKNNSSLKPRRSRKRGHDYATLEDRKMLAVTTGFTAGTGVLTINLADANEAAVVDVDSGNVVVNGCLLYTSPSPRDKRQSRMPSSA